jgi:hypothetical protein
MLISKTDASYHATLTRIRTMHPKITPQFPWMSTPPLSPSKNSLMLTEKNIEKKDDVSDVAKKDICHTTAQRMTKPSSKQLLSPHPIPLLHPPPQPTLPNSPKLNKFELWRTP